MQSLTKNETLPCAASWMDLEIIILSNTSQKEKDKKPYDITYRQNLKHDTNEHIYETEIGSWTQRTDLWLPGKGARVDGEPGARRCKLLYTGWVNKVLLHNAGNWIQCPEIHRNGKEYERKCVCIYIYTHTYIHTHN